MKIRVLSLIAASVLATNALADVQVTSNHKPTIASAKNETVSSCVEAIQSYHAKSARLFLNNKANYREVDGRRFLRVQGWVWKNGERVRVSHECTNTSIDDLALNVVFADEVQVAKR